MFNYWKRPVLSCQNQKLLPAEVLNLLSTTHQGISHPFPLFFFQQDFCLMPNPNFPQTCILSKPQPPPQQVGVILIENIHEWTNKWKISIKLLKPLNCPTTHKDIHKETNKHWTFTIGDNLIIVTITRSKSNYDRDF